jgi:hypothetical protein
MEAEPEPRKAGLNLPCAEFMEELRFEGDVLQKKIRNNEKKRGIFIRK